MPVPSLWLYRSGQPGRSDEIATLTPSAVFSFDQEYLRTNMRPDDQGESIKLSPSGPVEKDNGKTVFEARGGDILEVSSVIGAYATGADNHYKDSMTKQGLREQFLLVEAFS